MSSVTQYFSRDKIAVWTILVFFMLVLTSFFVAEFFQRPISTVHEINQYRTLFKETELQSYDHITLKNRLGVYELVRSSAQNLWYISSPRKILANQTPVANLLSSLSSIRIRKIYEYDPINTSNFSLEDPATMVTFKDDKGKELSIHFGLTNPIDGSSYIYHSENKAIYHIDAIPSSFVTLDLTNLIDSRVFTFTPSRVKKFSLSRIQGSKKYIVLELQRDDKRWIDQHKSPLLQDMVQELLKEFGAIKSLLILDNLPANLAEEVLKQKENSQFEIAIQDIDEQETIYTITNLTNQSWPELKIEKKQSFLIFAGDRDYQYVLPKEQLRLFNINHQALKSPSIKKLFY